MACVTELIAKAQITDAFKSGWDVAAPGCLPMPPPVSTCTSARISPVPGSERPQKKAKSSVRRLEGKVLRQFKQVVHLNSGCVHVWTGGQRSACGTWRCGAPDAAADLACFAKDKDVVRNTPQTPYCKSCYSEQLGFLGSVESACVSGSGTDHSGSDVEDA